MRPPCGGSLGRGGCDAVPPLAMCGNTSVARFGLCCRRGRGVEHSRCSGVAVICAPLGRHPGGEVPCWPRSGRDARRGPARGHRGRPPRRGGRAGAGQVGCGGERSPDHRFSPAALSPQVLPPVLSIPPPPPPRLGPDARTAPPSAIHFLHALRRIPVPNAGQGVAGRRSATGTVLRSDAATVRTRRERESDGM